MGIIAAPRVVRDMKSIADRHGIPYQLEVFMAGSTDVGRPCTSSAKGQRPERYYSPPDTSTPTKSSQNATS